MAYKEHDKYIVIKSDDVVRYLTWQEDCQLRTLINKIRDSRHNDGKSKNTYIVCNQDEVYSERLWELILTGETKKKGFFKRLFRR